MHAVLGNNCTVHGRGKEKEREKQTSNVTEESASVLMTVVLDFGTHA